MFSAVVVGLINYVYFKIDNVANVKPCQECKLAALIEYVSSEIVL